MLKQILFLSSSVLLTGLTISLPPAAQAIELWEVSQQRPNQQLDALFNKARRFVETGNYAGAIITYQQAAELDPKNPKIYSGIGYLRARQGYFEEAAKAYKQAVELEDRKSVV